MKLVTVFVAAALFAHAACAEEIYKHLSCYGKDLRIGGTRDATVTVRFSGTLRENAGTYRLTHYLGYVETFSAGTFTTFGVTQGDEVAGREYTEGVEYDHHVVFELSVSNDPVKLLHDKHFRPHEPSEIVLILKDFGGGFHGYAHVPCNPRQR